MEKLTGIHAVKEALEAGRPLEYVLVAKGRQDTRAEEIIQLARRNGISVRFEERAQLDRSAGTRDHQGVVAIGAARKASTFEDILAAANHEKSKPGLIVLLDGVEDPHNLGAIIRTALAAGARAHLPVAKVTNLVRTMEQLKEAGYWLVGLDERADKSYTEVDYTSPTGIVLGGEGGGLHELTRKRCDFVVSLPTSGPVKSLNVSVASGVVLFEALRQRHANK